MAKNPMQRKAQNSFLLGMFITLLITGIIIGFLFVQLANTQKEAKKLLGDRVRVCVLNTDVKSGQVITSDLIKQLEVDRNTIPSNSFGDDVSNLDTYSLEDIAGNAVRTDQNGNLCVPYIDKTTGEVVTNPTTGETQYRIIETNDGVNYYYQDTKEKVELTSVPVIAKIDINANSILTSSIITKSDKKVANDIRKMEYNMINLPSQIEDKQYVDVRLRLPSGKDYIVVSNKMINIPEIDGVPSLNTISLELDETEILTLSCAIVESYKISGAILYVNQYVEPGMQAAAQATYIPDDDTINLINRDPNCVDEAKQALFKRNNDAANKTAVRNPINNGLNENSDQANENAVTSIEEEIQKWQEERQKYLETLGGSY